MTDQHLAYCSSGPSHLEIIIISAGHYGHHCIVFFIGKLCFGSFDFWAFFTGAIWFLGTPKISEVLANAAKDLKGFILGFFFFVVVANYPSP